MQPSARFSPYGPPEWEKSHSDPESGDSDPIDARYEDAYVDKVWFHITAEALCSFRKKFVLLRIAEVKSAVSVNCGAVEAMLGGAVMVMVWTCTESGAGAGAGEAVVGARRTEASKPRRLVGRWK